jgi:hypothetical protein
VWMEKYNGLDNSVEMMPLLIEFSDDGRDGDWEPVTLNFYLDSLSEPQPVWGPSPDFLSLLGKALTLLVRESIDPDISLVLVSTHS